jgi:hypothetical protein
MYFKFSCPLCGTINFHGSALGSTYTRTDKCRGCGKSVTWSGSKTPGVQATLADAQPGVGIGSKEDVAALVAASATGNAIADIYSQGERIKEFTPTDASVQEGVCNGQSLHWIRRVLQGGRAEYKVQPSKSGQVRNPQTVDAKRRAQHMGGVATQKGTDPAELKKLSDAAYKDYSDAWEALDQKAKSANALFTQKMLSLGATKTADGWSYFPNDATNKAIATLDKVLELISEAKAKLTADDKARQAAGVYKHHWTQISKELDARLKEADAARKKRPYSGIVAIKASNRTKFAGGTTSFVDKLLADPDFKPGTCALLSSGLLVGIGEAGGEISGHAVAVHYAKNNVLRVFDPNIGVFSCTSTSGLKAALVAMIDRGWVKVFGWQLDNEFGYSLFEAKHSPVEAQPQHIQVQYAVSAETTSVQNKVVLPMSYEAPKAAPVKPQAVPLAKPVVPPVKPASVGGGGASDKAALRQKLQAAVNDGKRFMAKRGGVATADGLGYVKIDQELCKQLIAAKFTHPDLKGDTPMGSVLQKGTLNQIIAALG